MSMHTVGRISSRFEATYIYLLERGSAWPQYRMLEREREKERKEGEKE